MRAKRIGGKWAVGVLWSLAAVAGAALAADGDLDPAWGVGGVGAGLTNFRVNAATATGVGDAAFLGVKLSDPTDISAYWSQEPGTGFWSGCCGWEFDVPFLERFEGYTVMIDRDGRALFAGAARFLGSETVDRAFVGRSISSTGAPFGPFDDAFNGDGWKLFDDTTFCNDESCRIVDMVEVDSGSPRYVLLLERSVGLINADYFLVGLEANGALDSSYGANGYRQVAGAGIGQTAVSRARIAVDAARRVYVLHAFYDPEDGADVDAGLTRFDAEGDLDSTWGTSGTYQIDGLDDPPIAAVPGGLAIGPQGEILLGWNRLSAPQGAVLRIWRSGEPGASTVGAGFSQSVIADLTMDGLGRVIVARDSGADGVRVDRLIPNFPGGFTPDPLFGDDGSRYVDVDHPNGNGSQHVVALVLEGADYYVFVDADGSPGEDEHVVVPIRLLGSLLFADGFEIQSTRFW